MPTYGKFMRRRSFGRLRRSNMFLDWLNQQALRLRLTGAGATITAATNDNVTWTGHGKLTGDGPFQFTNSGGALPAGIVALTNYWVRFVDANTVTLHPSRAASLANTGKIDITTTGTGTQTVKRSADAYYIFSRMKLGKKAVTIRQITNIDNL